MELIDTSVYVSELTKRTLQQFGWEPGEPIPATFGELLSQIKERTPPTKAVGVLVDIAAMSAADIATVKDGLEAAKAAAEKAKNKEAQQALDPNIQQLQQAIQNAAASKADNEKDAIQIIDDRDAPSVSDAQPIAANQPVVTELPQVRRLPETVAPPALCPRCNWDTRQIYDMEITDFDKESFVAVTLGGERFKKSYSLLGDKYSVTFRGLFAEENTIIHHQLLLDQKDGHFLTDTEWFLRLFEYRLACSIARIEINNQIPRPIPELHEIKELSLPNKTDDKTKEPIVRIREYVLNDLLKTELTRRMVGERFRKFQRLYEALEVLTVEPSFW